MVSITNPAGTISSNPAVLNVSVSPPVITVEPTNVTIGINYAAIFNVSASGSGLRSGSTTVPHPEHRRYGNRPDATSSSLTIFDVSAPVAADFCGHGLEYRRLGHFERRGALTLTPILSDPGSGGGGGGGGRRGPQPLVPRGPGGADGGPVLAHTPDRGI